MFTAHTVSILGNFQVKVLSWLIFKFSFGSFPFSNINSSIKLPKYAFLMMRPLLQTGRRLYTTKNLWQFQMPRSLFQEDHVSLEWWEDAGRRLNDEIIQSQICYRFVLADGCVAYIKEYEDEAISLKNTQKGVRTLNLQCKLCHSPKNTIMMTFAGLCCEQDIMWGFFRQCNRFRW